MKVLVTADPELPVPPEFYGGIERIIDHLVKGLRKRGHTVGLVANENSTCGSDKLFPWPGELSQNRLDTFKNMVNLWNAVKVFQPDILHSFSRLMYMLPVMRSSLPKLMSYQRPPSFNTVSWASSISGTSLEFTGCSKYICGIGSNANGIWHPIHNCVNIDTYTFQPQVSNNAPLVFLSRIEKIKGTHNAIEVAKRTGRRLLIAGNYSESGENGRYWKDEIKPHIGKNGIEYVGTVNESQKNELLGSALAMIVPIEWDEPFGIVFAEALACGTPVISSPRGALPEIISNGLNGYLVNSTEEACSAVKNIGNIKRSFCRKRAEEMFSADVIVAQYEKLYMKIIKDNQIDI